MVVAVCKTHNIHLVGLSADPNPFNNRLKQVNKFCRICRFDQEYGDILKLSIR